MLSLMRKHAGSWMIKVLLGGVAVTFISWGGYRFSSERSGRVATVNGESITIEEYRLAYNRLLDQVRQSFGNNLNEELLKNMQLPKQAIDQLVNKLLMRQAATELELRVSNEDLSRSIRSISAFQTAGVFDPRRYKNVLDRNNLSPEGFEVNQRDVLLIEKLNTLITGSVKVSEQEANDWYKWNNATVDIEFVLFDPNRYSDIAVTAEEVQKYFEGNKESYKTEPQLKVQYVKFDPRSYVSQVKVTDDEIREYYDEHPDEFKMDKTVEARHILINVSQDAGQDEVDKARAQIESILQKAKEGQDFAELAKQYSQGPSKDQGGSLGTFTRETMVKPFADKAFSMKAGEISDPVRTQFGWHIIKVEKVNEATTTSYDDAKDGIRKNFADERSKLLAYDAAELIFDSAFESGDLETIASEHKLTLVTTDFFTRQGPKTGVQNKAKFAQIAFDLPEDEVSEIQDFGDGYYLLKFVEKLTPRIPELKEVEKMVEADLVEEKKGEKAKVDAEALLSALKEGEDLESAGKKFGLKPQTSGFFKRHESIPNVGFEREMSRVAFELSGQKKLPPEVIKGRKGYYVISFKQRKAPSIADFDKEKTDIINRLLQQKRSQTFNAWLEQVRGRSEIVYLEDFM